MKDSGLDLPVTQVLSQTYAHSMELKLIQAAIDASLQVFVCVCVCLWMCVCVFVCVFVDVCVCMRWLGEKSSGVWRSFLGLCIACEGIWMRWCGVGRGMLEWLCERDE